MEEKKIKLTTLNEYKSALATLREYFSRDLDTMDIGEDGAFDAKGWKAMTYLLQATVRYELDVLKLKIRGIS